MFREREERIIIIDSHPLSREGLKSILRDTRRYRIIAEAETAEDGFEKIASFLPNIAIIEPELPDESGTVLTERIKKNFFKTKLIIFTDNLNTTFIRDIFFAGADALLLKDADRDEILEAIESVENGMYFLDRRVTHELIQSLKNRKFVSYGKKSDFRLTKRENQILTLISSGLSTREIADKLYISMKTVENHRSNILRKLGLKNTAEMVRYAIRNGLIDVE